MKMPALSGIHCQQQQFLIYVDLILNSKVTNFILFVEYLRCNHWYNVGILYKLDIKVTKIIFICIPSGFPKANLRA